jgi:hypothetical protein
MPNRAYQAVGISFVAGKRFREGRIRLPLPVDVCRHKGPHPALIGESDALEIAVFLEHFPKVHEASTAPSSVSCFCQIHRLAHHLSSGD